MELRLFFRLCFAIAVASFCLTGHADEKDPMEHVMRHLDRLEGTVDELEEARGDAAITSVLTRIANLIDEIALIDCTTGHVEARYDFPAAEYPDG